MSTPTPKADLFGIPVDALTMAQVVERCRQSMLARERMLIGAVNAAKIVKMRENELLRSSVLEADLVIADGMAVVWASRILRRRLPERVTGIDLFERLLDVGHQEGLAAYFLGATPEVLEELLRRVRERWSGLRIAGAHDGYFKDEEAEAIAEEIAASGADMLFVGMTSPKKEVFLAKFQERMNVPLCHGVGGSFDVVAGKTKRAPATWQKLGLEWLYRVLQEPRRLWRRYLVTNVKFGGLVLRELVRPSSKR